MARRTMVERKRRAADRQTRRESLLVLLSRVQRGVPITPAEASLLRAHVEVEIGESNELRRTVQGQQNEIQRQGRQLDAAHTAIEEAEQAAADYREQVAAYRAVEAARQAPDRIDRMRAFLDEQTAHLTTTTPEPQP
jgi:phage shock protein A